MTGSTFTPDVVACLDVGSPKKGNVGWAILYDGLRMTGGDLNAFVSPIAECLKAGQTVAVGFECPLYIPRRTDIECMTSPRLGEVGLNWCGGPGASVLATGLAQVNWCLVRVAELAPEVRGTTRWDDFAAGRAPLYCWEAFITSRTGEIVDPGNVDELPSHQRDALCGALAFENAVISGAPVSGLGDEAAVSLIGLHLLQSGLAEDVSLLSERCTVLKVRKSL